MTRALTALAALVAVTAPAVAWWLRPEPPALRVEPEAIAVTRTGIEVAEQTVGVIIPRWSADLTAPATGTVSSLTASPGDPVTGATVATLTTPDGPVPVTAPAGVLTAWHVRVGQPVNRGDRLATLQAPERLVAVALDGGTVLRFDPANPPEILLATGTGDVPCALDRLTPPAQVDPRDLRTLSWLLECAPDDGEGLTPGVPVSVRIVMGSDPRALAVPVTALERVPARGGTTRVALADGSLIEVTVGMRTDFQVQITRGLDDGDRILDPFPRG